MITAIILACVVGGIIGMVSMSTLLILTAICKYLEYHPEASPNDATIIVLRAIINDFKHRGKAKEL